MGIFATRPEEPFEWAGIPSEPERAESDAERLPATAIDTSALGLAGSEGVASIVIPAAPATEPSPPPHSTHDGG